jgi:hypothetical protein
MSIYQLSYLELLDVWGDLESHTITAGELRLGERPHPHHNLMRAHCSHLQSFHTSHAIRASMLAACSMLAVWARTNLLQ